ncbi:MAG: hypothetical protein AB7H77_05240 [Bdellovibrionales bacterium]
MATAQYLPIALTETSYYLHASELKELETVIEVPLGNLRYKIRYVANGQIIKHDAPPVLSLHSVVTQAPPLATSPASNQPSTAGSSGTSNPGPFMRPSAHRQNDLRRPADRPRHPTDLAPAISQDGARTIRHLPAPRSGASPRAALKLAHAKAPPVPAPVLMPSARRPDEEASEHFLRMLHAAHDLAA